MQVHPHDYAKSHFYLQVYWSTCDGGVVSGDPVFINYSAGCSWVMTYVSGYYQDFSQFAGAALGIWTTANNVRNGQVSTQAGMDKSKSAAEQVLGVGIGGWNMEQVFSSGDYGDPDLRRAMEILWGIFGIARADAQEVPKSVGPPAGLRAGNDVYLVGHGAEIFGIHTGTHVALEHNLSTTIPCFSNTIPTCQTISAHPRDGSHVIYVANAREDEPIFNDTLGTVTKTGVSADALWTQLLGKASSYDNTAPYIAICIPFSGAYNSNSFVVGLINVVGAVSSYSLWSAFCGSTPIPASYYH